MDPQGVQHNGSLLNSPYSPYSPQERRAARRPPTAQDPPDQPGSPGTHPVRRTMQSLSAPFIPLAVTDQRAATTTPRDARPVNEREAGDLRGASGRNGLRRAVESGHDDG